MYPSPDLKLTFPLQHFPLSNVPYGEVRNTALPIIYIIVDDIP